MNDDEVLYMLLVSLTSHSCESCPLLSYLEGEEIPQCSALKDSPYKIKNLGDIVNSRRLDCPLIKLKDNMILGGNRDE